VPQVTQRNKAFEMHGEARRVAERLATITDPGVLRALLEKEEVRVYRAHVERCRADEPTADKKRLKVFTGRASVERKEFGTAVRRVLIDLLLREVKRSDGGTIETVEEVVVRIKNHAESVAEYKKVQAMDERSTVQQRLKANAIAASAASAALSSVGASSAAARAAGSGGGPGGAAAAGGGEGAGGEGAAAYFSQMHARGTEERAKKNRGSAAWRSALRKEMYEGYKRELRRALDLRAGVPVPMLSLPPPPPVPASTERSAKTVFAVAKAAAGGLYADDALIEAAASATDAVTSVVETPAAAPPHPAPPASDGRVAAPESWNGPTPGQQPAVRPAPAQTPQQTQNPPPAALAQPAPAGTQLEVPAQRHAPEENVLSAALAAPSDTQGGTHVGVHTGVPVVESG
jgi:hypothetical protein